MQSGFPAPHPLRQSCPYIRSRKILTSHTEPETSVDANPSAQAEAKAERGEKTAENVRYGQAISEHGMGGQTTSSTGQANQDSGFGGAADQAAQNDDAVETRKESGYGGDRDMDRTIGA